MLCVVFFSAFPQFSIEIHGFDRKDCNECNILPHIAGSKALSSKDKKLVGSSEAVVFHPGRCHYLLRGPGAPCDSVL